MSICFSVCVGLFLCMCVCACVCLEGIYVESIVCECMFVFLRLFQTSVNELGTSSFFFPAATTANQLQTSTVLVLRVSTSQKRPTIFYIPPPFITVNDVNSTSYARTHTYTPHTHTHRYYSIQNYRSNIV